MQETRQSTGPKPSVTIILVMGCLLTAHGARADLANPQTMQEVVEASEDIFVAVCVGRTSDFRSKNIVTGYQLKLVEVWKGDRAAPGETIAMDQLGGSIRTDVVSIGQYAGGQASFSIGEEVLLFTRRRKTPERLAAQAPSEPLFKADNPFLTHRYQGRYTILTDPLTREKRLIQHNSEMRGLMPSDEVRKTILNHKSDELRALTVESREQIDGMELPTDTPVRGFFDFQSLDSARRWIENVLREKERI